jgi:hypothetical protein
MTKFIQTRFIINGINIQKDQLQNNEFWLVDNELILKTVGNELSAFVVSKEEVRRSKEDDDGKKKNLAKVRKRLEEGAKEKILQYVSLCALLTNKTPTLRPSGSREISSINNVGKAPFSVERSIVIEPGLTLTKSFLDESKTLYHEIDVLHKNFSALNNANKFYYNASVFTFNELELGKFDSRRFIDAVVCLECLFNEHPSDLLYKICMRTAFLLGFIGYNRKDVFDKAKKLYKLRNDIVHGAGEITPTLDDLKMILDYAKKSLICCYILYGKRPKDKNEKDFRRELLKEIDYALLDDTKREEMSKEISSGIERFKWANIRKQN